MDNNQINEVLERFKAGIQLNLNCRRIPYDPAAHIRSEQNDTGFHCFMEVPYKLLWFYTYCQENNLAGSVEADDTSITMYTNDIGLVVAKARVLLNGNTVATAAAGKRFSLSDGTDGIDFAVQSASGRALSRALSNAGFGIFSSIDESSALNDMIPAGNCLPFMMPADFGTAPTGQIPQNQPVINKGFPSFPAGNPTLNQGLPVQCPPQQMSFANEDPLAWARATVWTGKGQNNGQTLGQILTGNPGLIEWIANSYRKEDTIRQAALALLPEAKLKLGKA